MAIASVRSFALLLWQLNRSSALDEFEEIHKSLGAKSSGIRSARNQINQAYAFMLSGQFQGFCRDLYSEATDHLSKHVSPAALQPIIKQEFGVNRKLDTGNPNPSNIGSDFNRFGLIFWSDVKAHSPLLQSCQSDLELLNKFRNQVAHQDFGASTIVLIRHAQVKAWRKSCNQLAEAFEVIIGRHLAMITGVAPW